MPKYSTRLPRVKGRGGRLSPTFKPPREAALDPNQFDLPGMDRLNLTLASDADSFPGQPSSPVYKWPHRPCTRDNWRSKRK